jgi:hypothetical protein
VEHAARLAAAMLARANKRQTARLLDSMSPPLCKRYPSRTRDASVE